MAAELMELICAEKIHGQKFNKQARFRVTRTYKVEGLAGDLFPDLIFARLDRHSEIRWIKRRGITFYNADQHKSSFMLLG